MHCMFNLLFPSTISLIWTVRRLIHSEATQRTGQMYPYMKATQMKSSFKKCFQRRDTVTIAALFAFSIHTDCT